MIDKKWDISSQGYQTSIKRDVLLTGKGLFTGKKVSLRLCPAKENHGIMFQRMDLEGRPILPAKVESVVATPRCTILGKDNNSMFHMVEHLLSAIYAYGIDNILIQMDSQEVLAGDGSANIFIG